MLCVPYRYPTYPSYQCTTDTPARQLLRSQISFDHNGKRQVEANKTKDEPAESINMEALGRSTDDARSEAMPREHECERNDS